MMIFCCFVLKEKQNKRKERKEEEEKEKGERGRGRGKSNTQSMIFFPVSHFMPKNGHNPVSIN